MNLKLIFILSFFLFNYLSADDAYLNIDAKHFEADEKKQKMTFKGDVKMTKLKDILLCEQLVILTQPSKQDSTKQVPKIYEATGKVSFVLNTEDNILKGKGDKVIYYPDEKKYIIIGNGNLEDTKEGKNLVAQKIYIDELTGHTRIDGDDNKPIKFRMKLDEKQQ